jgi:hypothetical protein
MFYEIKSRKSDLFLFAFASLLAPGFELQSSRTNDMRANPLDHAAAHAYCNII